jgi:hypothetical protein
MPFDLSHPNKVVPRSIPDYLRLEEEPGKFATLLRSTFIVQNIEQAGGGDFCHSRGALFQLWLAYDLTQSYKQEAAY